MRTDRNFRAIAVDARGILEVPGKVYGARRVLDEIEAARRPVATQ